MPFSWLQMVLFNRTTLWSICLGCSKEFVQQNVWADIEEIPIRSRIPNLNQNVCLQQTRQKKKILSHHLPLICILTTSRNVLRICSCIPKHKAKASSSPFSVWVWKDAYSGHAILTTYWSLLERTPFLYSFSHRGC